MNPVSRTKEKRGFYVTKLSYEGKINMYQERKNENTINNILKNTILEKNIILSIKIYK